LKGCTSPVRLHSTVFWPYALALLHSTFIDSRPPSWSKKSGRRRATQVRKEAVRKHRMPTPNTSNVLRKHHSISAYTPKFQLPCRLRKYNASGLVFKKSYNIDQEGSSLPRPVITSPKVEYPVAARRASRRSLILGVVGGSPLLGKMTD